MPYKSNIIKINLKGNKIKYIDDLLEFTKKFPNLKELILLDNPINMNNSKYKKIINEIKIKDISVTI